MAGIGCIEILIVAVLILALVGMWVSRARRKREEASPPEDDAGW